MPPVQEPRGTDRADEGPISLARHEPGATNHEGGEVYADAQDARGARDPRLLAGEPDWHTALVVAHEGINRLLLSWACGAGLMAMGAFEQDTGCINVLDFDLGGTGAMRTRD